MQSKEELRKLLTASHPDTDEDTLQIWITVLSQLKGCHVHSFAEQGVDDAGWHAARAKGIGGSEIAAILGKSSWSSPTDIYMKKIPQFESEPEPQTESARWGNVLEDVIIKEWAHRTGRHYVHIPVSLQSDENPIFIANVDGFEVDADNKLIGLLECKTTTLYNESLWADAEVPIYYIYQIQWYMSITGLENTCIMCLVGGQHLYYYDFPASSDIAEEEKAGAIDFWNNHVIPMIPPALTALDADRLQKIKAEEEEHAEPIITEDTDTYDALQQYVEYRRQISELEKEKKKVYAKVLDKLGTANELLASKVDEDGENIMHTAKCSYANRRTCDFETLEKFFPDVYAKVVKQSTSVRIIIK